MGPATFWHVVIGDLVVTLFGENEPTDAEWDAYLDDVREMKQRSSVVRVLVYTKGGAPNSVQRTRLGLAVGKDVSPTVILTDSMVALGILTMLQLVNPTQRVFGVKHFIDGCRHLQLPREKRLQAISAIRSGLKIMGLECPTAFAVAEQEILASDPRRAEAVRSHLPAPHHTPAPATRPSNEHIFESICRAAEEDLLK